MCAPADQASLSWLDRTERNIHRGVYLELVKNEKLVFTDAYTSAWVPSGKPFMTVILTFENEGGKTRYTGACAIGPPKTRQPTRRWVSMAAGAFAPTNSPHSSPNSSFGRQSPILDRARASCSRSR
jgi:uncharacterized protein YndB with AHSA1/START domain